MPQYTLYEYSAAHALNPRCKNSHTLSPLFMLRDEEGQLVTDPVPIEDVPHEFLFINSDGYGFDVRNLAMLMRVNFRNLNPHTIDACVHGHIWCNSADMNALLHHPKMSPTVLQTVVSRSRIVNALTDESKELIASVAGELYSYSYQGFYDWVSDMKTVNLDTIFQALGMSTTRAELMREIVELQEMRRNTTLSGIRSHLGVQATEPS